MRLAQEGEKWKIFTIFTSLRELKDAPEGTGVNRPAGVQHGALHGRKNWLDRRAAEVNYEDSQPDVLVVGRFFYFPCFYFPFPPLHFTSFPFTSLAFI